MYNVYANNYYTFVNGKLYCFRLHRKFNEKDFVVETVSYKRKINKKEKKVYFCLLDPTLFFVKHNWIRHDERKEGIIISKYFIEVIINECNKLNA